MATYINGRFENDSIETIDEFETYKEARDMLAEYRLSYGSGWDLWLSQRSTNEWRLDNEVC